MTPLEQLRHALAIGAIDRATYDVAAAGMTALLQGDGAIAQGADSRAVGSGGVGIGNDLHGNINTGRQIAAAEGSQVIFAEQGATIVIGDAPVAMKAVDRHSALGRYLQYVIGQNRYLQLQGIRSGGKVVNIELDRIYVSLRATRQFSQRTEGDWLADEAALAPGERQRVEHDLLNQATNITVNAALAAHKRLVVLGDPGSGKTTLLRYLALLHARDLADTTRLVDEKLGLKEDGVLPIFLPLRQIGRFLAEHHGTDDGTDGHALLLQFLAQVLSNERIAMPHDFFDDYLTTGRAAILLDGLDEVANPALRRRVARLVDSLTRAHPLCRYVITSRIVGYTEASQLSEGYATTTVRDFSRDDLRTFLTQWHRLVAIGQNGPGVIAETQAAQQTQQLLEAIDNNDRVRELAINPLLLTVIALVHRDRVKLPDRRAELYQEAVDVLLGKWDEARGLTETVILGDRPFDISDRRLLLQQVALTMHERAIKEIQAEDLRELLAEQLKSAVIDARERDLAVTRFLQVIQERTGLLIARAEGSYAFSHLTFQEYLAALALAAREDYVAYTLRNMADPWWREVILLEAGHLSTQSKERTTRLIRAIADNQSEPAPYHNLVLAADCLRDAGANRIVGDVESELRERLRRELEAPVATGLFATLLKGGINPKASTKRRIAAAEAMGQIGGSAYWTPPYGEPQWVEIPAGEFDMGEAAKMQRIHLPDYTIASVPITQAQYWRFVQATNHAPPEDWNSRRPPRGKEAHPVVCVSWHDALAYCGWLSDATGKFISLPAEAEWEKAARGDLDQREYPWGDRFDAARCNSSKSGFGMTTPVGIFANGASPYGCLDMAGNVWEWTRSLLGRDWRQAEFGYPSDHHDPRREDVEAGDDVLRVLRGGSWYFRRGFARCASRLSILPGLRSDGVGFRVVLRSSPGV